MGNWFICLECLIVDVWSGDEMFVRNIEIKFKDILFDLLIVCAIIISIAIFYLSVFIIFFYSDYEPLPADTPQTIETSRAITVLLLCFIFYYLFRRKFSFKWTLLQFILNVLFTYLTLYAIFKLINATNDQIRNLTFLFPLIIVVNKHILDIILLKFDIKKIK